MVCAVSAEHIRSHSADSICACPSAGDRRVGNMLLLSASSASQRAPHNSNVPQRQLRTVLVADNAIRGGYRRGTDILCRRHREVPGTAHEPRPQGCAWGHESAGTSYITLIITRLIIIGYRQWSVATLSISRNFSVKTR